jgi:translation initiation factor 4E
MSKSEGALPCPSLRHVKLHPLEYSWSFWFLKGDRTKSWFDCLQKVAEIHTIEDFWEYDEFTSYNEVYDSLILRMYHDNSPASSLRWGSDYYLFKTDIQPMWEDPKNVNGGRWLASVDKVFDTFYCILAIFNEINSQ